MIRIAGISSRCMLGGALAMALLVPFSGAEAKGFRVLYSFTGGSDGSQAYGGLLAGKAGALTGTTYAGGAHGDGAIFTLASDGKETVLYSFAGYPNDGRGPVDSLIGDQAGNLYGTTTAGGADDCGIVFELAPSGSETVLHSFTAGSDGCDSDASLIMDTSGNLYGTTLGGGTDTRGVVFKLAPDGTETVLHIFTGGSDGGNPYAALIADSAGNLYSTTASGGANNDGAVFEIAPDGTETVLYSFAGGSDGDSPYGVLIADQRGDFYGTTAFGGAKDCGTIFKLTPRGKETVLYTFAGGSDGCAPDDGLLMDKSGNFYGTTSSGGGTGCEFGQGCGSIFRLAANGRETVLYSFGSGSDGEYPFAGVIAGKNGRLYGTTPSGGADGEGNVFRLKE